MPQKTYKIEDFLSMCCAVAPAWSFDDSQIVYMSDKSGTMQLYIMPAEGGKEIQLTDYPDPITDYSISKTENKIVFSKAEKGNEQAQLYIFDINTKEAKQLTDNNSARYDLGSWSQDGRYISFSSTERNGTDFDVYVMDMKTFKSKIVFSKGGRCFPAGFSPSTQSLVITQRTTSNKNNDLFLYNLKTDTVECLTENSNEACYGDAQWMPDGSGFFTVTNLDREFWGLTRYDIQKGTFTYVFTPKWNVWRHVISRDGNQILVMINEDGYTSVSVYRTDSFELIKGSTLKGFFRGINFSKDGTRIVYSLSGARSTYNIYIRNLKTGVEQQLTSSAQGIPKEELVEPKLIRYQSFDGLSVPAFVYKPKDIPKGIKLPVIINIHGGPASQYMPGFNPFVQYFVKAGYVVVAPNVRGSAGYGKSYLALDDVEKRMDSVKDIVALREYLTTLPEVDVDRIVLMGGSYGGFMVNAGLAFYPDLWAGGVCIVGISNFVTFLENTAPYRRALRESEYGSLKNDRKFLESISPINSADNIRAPLLIVHGANDPRVPLSEAEQMMEKIKEHGGEVELIVYPDEGHGIVKHKNKIDLYPRIIAFLEKYIKA
jgi:dipeptidyl aminopeptidase/acylaminoacyl peptidase